MSGKTPPEETEIRVRPFGPLVSGAILLPLLPLLILLPARNLLSGSIWWVAGGISLLLLAIVGILWKYAAQNVVVGTAKGLRWRRWRGTKAETDWQEADWEQVTDFYWSPGKSSWGNYMGAPLNVVRLRDGRMITFDWEWTNESRLRDRIVSRSVNAEGARLPDGTIGWSLKGARPSDLPTSFFYPEKTMRRKLRGGNRRTLSIFAGAFLLNAWWLLTPVVPLAEGGWVLPIVSLLFLGLEGFHWWSERRPWMEVKRRLAREERLESTTEGLVLWQGGEKQTAPWQSIIGYELPETFSPFTLSVGKVRTLTGKEFTFTAALEDYEVFAHTLRTFAREAVEYRRDRNEQQALGGMELRWTGGEEGKGDRVFHARTRLNRNNLWFSWGFLAIALAMAVVHYARLSKPLGGMMAFFAAILPFLALWKIVTETRDYFRDGVVCGKESIRLTRQGKVKEIRWGDVIHWRTELGRILLEGVDGTKLDVKPDHYAYGNELPDLIRERIEQVAADRATETARQAREARVWSNDRVSGEQQRVRGER